VIDLRSLIRPSSRLGRDMMLKGRSMSWKEVLTSEDVNECMFSPAQASSARSSEGVGQRVISRCCGSTRSLCDSPSLVHGCTTLGAIHRAVGER
jgi:hypothetical protein